MKAAAPTVLAALALVAAGVLSAAADGVRVQYRDQRLWVKADAVPAAQVLSAVATQTGVRFVMDSEIKPGPITIDIDGMALERAIRSLVGQIAGAAGHTMTYARRANGAPRLTQVTLYGPGKAPAEGSSVVYGGEPGPSAYPTPDLHERMQKMVEAGVPHETAEKVIDLTREVQQLQATPAPGTYRPEDLPPAAREQLQPLIERGIPMERAVQMLLLQERYKETLGELSRIPGATALTMPSPPPGAAAPTDGD